jgi:hypothetical protein
MNPDNTLEILIKLGFIGADQADDARKAIAGVKDETTAGSKATDKATDSFGSSRREIRMLGNELGRVAGVSGAGMLFLGGVASAAFAAAKAIGLVKTVWQEIQATIKGPIEIDVPPEAAGHITAVAEAWNTFVEARAKVVAAENTPQAEAGREEKKLQNELKLIKEVLAAEREKAMIEAGSDKDAQERVKAQFDHAGKQADEASRQQQIKVKEVEMARLVADAQKKYTEAGNIRVTPEDEVAKRQKVLDENAAAAAADLKQRQERIEMIDRQTKYRAGGAVAEYEGSTGEIKRLAEDAKLYAGWGNMGDLAGYRTSESTHAGLDQASIDRAETYRKNEEAARKKKTKLTEDAGTESGQAEVLSRQIADDKAAAAAQAAVDAHGRAGLPQATAGRGMPTGASAAPGSVPFERTPEGMARHDFSMMEQYGEFTRQGGQLDQHQQDILKGMVSALVGHNATNREIKEALDEVLGTQRERDAIFQSFRRELQQIKNDLKTAH